MISEFPKKTRAFFDPDVLRDKVLENAKDAFQHKLNTIESNNFKLKLENVHYPEPNKTFSIQEQKDAILEKRDLSVPLKGKFTLINKKDGSVVDSKETIIARIPWVTNRNTTVMGGVEGVSVNQQRLKSGVYCRRAKSGILEGHINVDSGSGLGGKVIFNPQIQQFYYQIANSKFHLYSLLNAFGMTDAALEKEWGSDLLNRNRKNYDPTVVDKLYNKIFTR
jgi:DNA-directed RNA polymerase beta subunit